MNINTLKDIENLQGKKVLLRVDFNVPLKENGDIQDDTRMKESLPTINYLLEKGARIIILTHLGRPDGQVKEELRVTKIAKHLATLLKGTNVKKLDESLGQEVSEEIEKMRDSEILMLENIRFHKEEETCEESFTKALSQLGEIFINDAFGTAHRRHTSTAGLADHLPAYAGLLMEKEINALSPLVDGNVKGPLTMIFGGAKIDTKIGIINHFIKKADYFLMGGALANTFLAAAGYNVGASLYEKDQLETARSIMQQCEAEKSHFVLPHDVVVGDKIADDAESAHLPIEDVIGDMKILDIGKWTAEKYVNIIENSGTVVWNGPLGLYEYKPFIHGSQAVMNGLANSQNVISILGGGDTLDCMNRLGIPSEKFSHVSTGGGACIEFLSGEKLPGIEALKKPL